MSSPTQGRDAEGALGSVGPYTLVTEIARGELCTVFLATRALPGGGQRRAVIKRLRPELAGAPEWESLVEHEARCMAAVHHPNVAAVLPDAAEIHEAVPYEYVDGESLDALLARADISNKPKILLPIFSDVLRGLASVHGAMSADGEPLVLVHQAPRAHHIVVGIDGGARLVDFSQSLSIEAAASRERADRLQVAYMAPEQALDPDNVDARADLYVLGIALWEALTGERLFAGANAEETFQQMLHREVPKPSTVGRKPPAAFDTLCLHALERRREKRFATAGEMLAALSDVGRAIGGPSSAFEVGQWVMALAGATLRARHSRGRGASVPPPGERSGSAPPRGAFGSTPASGAPKPLVMSRPPKPAQRDSVRPAAMSEPPPPAEPQPSPGTYGAASKLPPEQAAAIRARDIRSHLPPLVETISQGAPVRAAAVQEVGTPVRAAAEAAQPPSTPAAAPSTPAAAPSTPAAAPSTPAAAPSTPAAAPSTPAAAPRTPLPFGTTTMIGGFSGDGPAAPAPASSGRQRVRTLQALAAVSVAPPPVATGSAAPSKPAEPTRPRSDAPTEVLSSEEAQQLTALTAALPNSARPAARPSDGGAQQGRFGRATEELYSMPPSRERADERGSVAKPAADAGGSSPDETVVGDRSQLEQHARATAKGSSTPQPLSGTLVGAVAPASLRPRREPEVGKGVALVATGRGPEDAAGGAGDARALAPYVAPVEPAGFARAMSKLIFVPPLEDDEEGVWGESSRPPPPKSGSPAEAPGAVSIDAARPPARRRWAMVAVVGAFAVGVVVVVLGAHVGGSPTQPESAEDLHPAAGAATAVPPVPALPSVPPAQNAGTNSTASGTVPPAPSPAQPVRAQPPGAAPGVASGQSPGAVPVAPPPVKPAAPSSPNAAASPAARAGTRGAPSKPTRPTSAPAAPATDAAPRGNGPSASSASSALPPAAPAPASTTAPSGAQPRPAPPEAPAPAADLPYNPY